jgi:hypothetical protein
VLMSRLAWPRGIRIGLALVLLSAVPALLPNRSRAEPRDSATQSAIARVARADSLLGQRAALAIIPHVSGAAAWDSTTHLWRYTYKLTNDRRSRNVIREFALKPVPRFPAYLVSPPHWAGSYGHSGCTECIDWSVVDAQQERPATWDSVSDYPSVFDLQLGDSVSFSFEHRSKPATITYHVQGFYFQSTHGEAEGPDDPTVFQKGITGTVIGPGGSAAKALRRRTTRATHSGPGP